MTPSWVLRDRSEKGSKKQMRVGSEAGQGSGDTGGLVSVAVAEVVVDEEGADMVGCCAKGRGETSGGQLRPSRWARSCLGREGWWVGRSRSREELSLVSSSARQLRPATSSLARLGRFPSRLQSDVSSIQVHFSRCIKLGSKPKDIEPLNTKTHTTLLPASPHRTPVQILPIHRLTIQILLHRLPIDIPVHSLPIQIIIVRCRHRHGRRYGCSRDERRREARLLELGLML